MQLCLDLQFLSDWHVSSGLGGGYRTDAELNRDSDGLPFISGRALKGALREGARCLGLCRQDLREAEFFFWGSRSLSEESNQSGRIRVSSAHFPDSVCELLRSCTDLEEIIQDLTIQRQQTAVDDKGIVVPHSLRSIECGMAGITLEARLDILEPLNSEAWSRAYFIAVCAAVRSVGGHRSRGLGRCRLSVRGAESHVVIPPQPGDGIRSRSL